MIRIRQIEAEPLHRVPYLNAAKRGGTETRFLDITLARADGLTDCDALLVTSDLQGMAASWYEGGASVLLGEALAEQLEVLAQEELVPPLSDVGVVLAGDLYSVPDANKRGGLGDVSSVWYTFASGFRWVVGVAGNHDDFGRDKDKHRLMSEDNIHLLDTEVVSIDGLRVGGVSYIAGNPAKRGRRSEDEQLERLGDVLDERPDLLVLHEGPCGDDDQRGNQRIRELIEAAPPSLTICGHSHWDRPLAELPGGEQILNVDARALLLVP